VLIVEDDETNRYVLETVLQNSGMRITIARNGREAVEFSRYKDFDLIFMDCQMPVMDGFLATEQIIAELENRQGKRPAIIALTADATQLSRQRCKDVGMDDYLLKPLEFRKLQLAIDNWLPAAGIKISASRHHHSSGDTAKTEAGRLQGKHIDPGVLRKLKENMGNVRAVIGVYLDSLPGRLKHLQEAIESDQAESVRGIAHTIKGSSSQFGAVYLAGLCERLERSAKSNKLENAAVLYRDITDAAKEIVGFLQEELDKSEELSHNDN